MRRIASLRRLTAWSLLWKRNKSDLSEEDYNNFYKDKFFDFSDPLLSIHTNAEGAVTYNAILYVPSKAPFNYYTKEFQRGLQLYSSGVLIMDNCPELLPDYFSFVLGLRTRRIFRSISPRNASARQAAETDRKEYREKGQERTEKLLDNDRENIRNFSGFSDFPSSSGSIKASEHKRNSCRTCWYIILSMKANISRYRNTWIP